jgi:hypothetical protein
MNLGERAIILRQEIQFGLQFALFSDCSGGSEDRFS